MQGCSFRNYHVAVKTKEHCSIFQWTKGFALKFLYVILLLDPVREQVIIRPIQPNFEITLMFVLCNAIIFFCCS